MILGYRRSIAVFFAVLLTSAGMSGCPKDSANQLRPALGVVTWNVQGCARGLQPVVDELRRFDKDIVCLQEVHAGTQPSSEINQAADIAGRLGMNEFSAGSQLPNGDEQRMAILFRGELAAPEILDAGTGRIYGVTAVIDWQGKPVRIVSLHFTSSYRLEVKHAFKSTLSRYEEATDLAGRLQKWSGDIIVAGDFNALPEMPPHLRIAKHLTRAPTTQPTYPSEKPAVAIDHIYHSRNLRATQWAVEQSTASDHRPVTAEIIRNGKEISPRP